MNTSRSPNAPTWVWLITLSMLGFLATDMYLPAFEVIRQDYATSQASIELSLSVFLLGMATGQIIYGPLSEYFGRYPILIAGLLVFFIATLVCSLAQNIEMFLIARFFQALGACSASVLWQAIVMDRFPGQKSQSVMATIMPLVALSPALAPILGAFIEQSWGWRAIFYTLLALAFLLLVRTRQESKDNSQQMQQRDTLQIRSILQNYLFILSSQLFKAHTLMLGSISAAFFAYLTGSAFIMDAMGYSGMDIGVSYLPQTIAFVFGGYSCKFLLKKYSGIKILPFFILIFGVAAMVIFLVGATTTPTSIWPILGPFCLIALANGGLYPIITHQVLSHFSSTSATAAGLLNFFQTLVCFAASAMVSALSYFGVITVTSIIGLSCLGLIAGFILLKNSVKG